MEQQITTKITGLASKSEIARRLGVKPQLVGYWFKQGVPPHRVIQFCAALNWSVTPHQVDSVLYTWGDSFISKDGIQYNSVHYLKLEA